MICPYKEVQNKTIMPYDLYKYELDKIQLVDPESIVKPLCVIPYIDTIHIHNYQASEQPGSIRKKRFWLIPFQRCFKSEEETYDENYLECYGETFKKSTELQKMNEKLIGATQSTTTAFDNEDEDEQAAAEEEEDEQSIPDFDSNDDDGNGTEAEDI